jgi:transcriptional regulator with XRE-family HTH domain
MVARIGPRNSKRWRVFFKEWREAKELTQEQLAARLGTTHVTISRMETGAREWNAGYLSAMAEALGIEPQDLFHHPSRPTLDELLRDASEEDRNRALEVVKTLTKLAS